MKLLSRRFALLLTTATALAAPLLAPASASAIMVGAEANGELVNSDRTPALQAIALDKMQKQGVQVVRANVGWNEIAVDNCASQSPAALGNHLNGCYDWSRLDSLVQLAQERRIRVMVSITRVPRWVNRHSDPMFMGASGAQFNRVLQHYVAFHKAAGTRYRRGSAHGTIAYWTIHNESNSPQFWAPRPNPQRYALLYARTAVALKKANPHALIAPGPTNPTGGGVSKGGIKPLKFVRLTQPYLAKYLPGSMANKRRHLNAWAHNPYPGTTSQPSVTQGRAPHREMITMATIDRLFTQLDRHPLTRRTKVWGTEFGWETSGNARVSLGHQAQFIAEAFDWLDSKRRVTIGISYGLTDNTIALDWQSGTFHANGRPKPSFRMFQRMVSVPKAGKGSRVRRGTVVRVWGRSNVNSRTGMLAYKRSGSSVWRVVPRQKRKADGSIVASFRVTAKVTQFAVYDKGNAVTGVRAGYGPTRIVRS